MSTRTRSRTAGQQQHRLHAGYVKPGWTERCSPSVRSQWETPQAVPEWERPSAHRQRQPDWDCCVWRTQHPDEDAFVELEADRNGLGAAPAPGWKPKTLNAGSKLAWLTVPVQRRFALIEVAKSGKPLVGVSTLSGLNSIVIRDSSSTGYNVPDRDHRRLVDEANKGLENVTRDFHVLPPLAL